MPVSDLNPDYTNKLTQWEMVRDCVCGSQAVKSRNSGKRYLPAPNESDESKSNTARYQSYLFRAVYANITGNTKEGLLGMVFNREMTVDLPAQIEYLEADFTGGGLSLDQAVKEILGDTLELGRYGLLVDYPEADQGLTQAEVTNLNFAATVKMYPAESVINWKTDKFGSQTKLSMVVLREPVDVYADDGFSFDTLIYHRHLFMDEGVYKQVLYNEADEVVFFDDEAGQPEFEIVPRKSDGSTWSEIPFIFVGSENNDEIPDKSPLIDIAEVNLAHYRNSADYEESSFMVGQPTLILSGLNQTYIDKVLKDGLMLGSRAAIPLNEGGSGELLQADPNQMPLEGMKTKEELMVKLGAKIIQDVNGNETVDAAKMRFAGQNSKLGVIVGNVEDAIIKCFGWAMEFMGGTGDVEYKMNRQFYDLSIDPQLIMAGIQLMDRGTIAKSDMQDKLRETGFLSADRSNEDINNEAEAVNILE